MPHPSTPNGRIYVESEFAPLRTVVLTQSEVSIPKGGMSGKNTSFLPKGSTSMLEGGEDFGVAFPDMQAAWELERETLGAVLIKHGVQVLRPRKLTAAEKATAGADGYSNFFVRDPFFTVGKHVIEGSLRFLHRRKEILPVRGLLEGHVYSADSIYVAAPQPAVADAGDETLGLGPFIEGGDVLVLGKQVFVGNSGLASNTQGVKWLRKLLAPSDYQVQEVRLHPEILHLDCALGLVRDGLMVVCPDAFLDGIPSALSQWDRIPVTLNQAGQLATNGLPISPEIYVTDPVFEKIGSQLERRGIKVEYVDFKISRSFGGAFRCSTQALLRAQ